MSLMTIEKQYTSGVYGKRDVMLVRGRGAIVWDDNGREYIDCVAGVGVANVGHCHPAIMAAIAEQSQQLLTCPEMFYNDRRAKLLQRLSGFLPGGLDRIFLCNSGTEAVEGAIKFARLSTGRQNIIATTRGFHGRTLGALSATHKKEYRDPFLPLVPGFAHVAFNDVDALDAAATEDTAAILLEVIQGEGGIHPATADYLQAARRLCDERGIFLIIDEVQTGFCRTGQWFACQHFGIVPDMLVMGKAIAGGMPMGAIGIGPRVTGLKPGVHGSTFGGNPLACAASLAALQIYQEENLATRAAEMGVYFRNHLEEINSPLIREIRGQGLMVGVELKIRAAQLVESLMSRGVLSLVSGTTVLRLLPPLVIEQEALDNVTKAIAQSLAEIGVQ